MAVSLSANGSGLRLSAIPPPATARLGTIRHHQPGLRLLDPPGSHELSPSILENDLDGVWKGCSLDGPEFMRRMALGLCLAVSLQLLVISRLGCQGIRGSSAAAASPTAAAPHDATAVLPARLSGDHDAAAIASFRIQGGKDEVGETQFPSSGGRRSLSGQEAEEPNNSGLQSAGKVMTDPITVYFIWFGPWEEASKTVIRTAFQSLGPGSISAQDPDGAQLPTLDKWWELVRQYKDPSTNLPVTDTVTVGEECAFDPGSNVTVTQDMVLSTFHRALNASDGGPGGALNCTGAPSLPQSADAVYYLVISRALGTLDPSAAGGDYICACSGHVPVSTALYPLKLVWSKQPRKRDYCNFWSQSETLLGAPNGDSGLDTLVSIMLGELVEVATAVEDGQQDLSVNQRCPWPYGDDGVHPDAQSVLTSDVGRFSYNVVGINGSRYMVQQLWSQESGNCMLQRLTADTCTTTQIWNQAQGSFQQGLIVDARVGLQPCRRNLTCSWLISVDGAKFIRIWLKYLATTLEDSLVVHTRSKSPSSCPININGQTLMSGTSRLSAGQRSRKLVDSVENASSPSREQKDRFVCSTPFAGFLYNHYPVDAMVQDSEIRITFDTGDTVNPSTNGFVIEYEAVFCHGEEIVTSRAGNISDGSPDGQIYGKELNCSWVLLGKPNTPVEIRFTRIDTVNGSDVVALYQGSSISDDLLPFRTISGNSTGPLPPISILGPMVIVFTTKEGGRNGWEAEYTISSPESIHHGGWTQAVKAGVAAGVVGAVFILAVGTMLWCYNRTQKSAFITSADGKLNILSIESLSLLKLNAASISVFSPSQLFKATDGFSQQNLLSRGRAGLLYRGRLADGSLVTVKRPPSTDLTSTSRELEILAGLANDNVVKTVGYSSNPFGRMLVFEHMGNGSLRDALVAVSRMEDGSTSQSKSAVLSWKLRLKISIHIARGLEYLHMYADPCIIHRSLKSSNVLLDKTWVPHISGFHHAVICRTGDQVQLFTTPRQRYAPDASPMSQTSTVVQVSKADDIFSFGVVLLEILTGKQPLDPDTFTEGHKRSHLIAQAVALIESGQGLTILDPRLPMPSNSQALLKLAEIAVWCLLPASQERPTVMEVVKGLEQVLKMYLSPPRSVRLGRPRVDPAFMVHTRIEKL